MALVTGGPVQPAASTVTDLLTIPADTQVHDPIVVVTNTDLDNPATFGISRAMGGAADDPAQYQIPAGSGIGAGVTVPIPVYGSYQEDDVIRVVSSGGVNFFCQVPPSPPR